MNQPKEDQGPQEGAPQFDLEGWVEELAAAVVAGIERQTSPEGLTAVEFTVMRSLAERPERTTQEIHETLPTDVERLGELVQSLTERGLLHEIAPETGGGVPLLALTQSGRELVWRLHMRVQAEGARLLAGVSPEEMEALAAVVSRIVANHATLDRRP